MAWVGSGGAAAGIGGATGAVAAGVVAFSTERDFADRFRGCFAGAASVAALPFDAARRPVDGDVLADAAARSLAVMKQRAQTAPGPSLVCGQPLRAFFRT